MKKPALVASLLVASLFSLPALAQDRAPQRSTSGGSKVLQISEITIVGRVQKPIAAVDVAKIQPKLTLSELTKTFVGRIEAAVSKDPF
jgi:hypothetical protein